MIRREEFSTRYTVQHQEGSIYSQNDRKIGSIWVTVDEETEDILVHNKSLFGCGHANFLPVLQIHEQRRSLLYAWPNDVILLADWMTRQGHALKPFRMLPWSNTISTYVQDAYKTIFKGLIDFIIYLHDKNLATTKLTTDHLCVVGNQVKIFGITVKESTPEAKNADYLRIHQIIHGIVSHPRFSIPLDFEHFMDMLNYSGTLPRYLCSHLALLPVYARRNFLLRAFEISNMSLSENVRSSYDRCVSSMGSFMNWKQTYAASIVGCMRAVLNQGFYSDNLLVKFQNNLNLLRFWRNMIAHVHEHEVPSAVRGKEECIIMWVFGDIICDLHILLYAYGLLPLC